MFLLLQTTSDGKWINYVYLQLHISTVSAHLHVELGHKYAEICRGK